MNHDLVQVFPPNIRDGGVTGGKSNRQQHQQLLVVWETK